SLALCALSGNFVVLSLARLLIGVAGAAVFVGGAALATTIAQSRPERANFLMSLFYAGPGLGILSSGLIAPFVLQAFGPGSWWIVGASRPPSSSASTRSAPRCRSSDIRRCCWRYRRWCSAWLFLQ